jgi:Domain of unknown function (DUF1841)
MFSTDRDTLRRYLASAWRKAAAGAPLEPLERQIAALVREHPEYQPLLADPEVAIERDFTPEAGEGNPFLHLGLHLALLEQVATDRPPGVRDQYQRLVQRAGDAHTAEHLAMECLAQALWEAQHTQRQPDEAAYLECLTRL